MSSSQKSQFRSDNRDNRNGQNHEDTSRRVPFRAIPINRKNQLIADNLDLLPRRNERINISIDTPTNSKASNKRYHGEEEVNAYNSIAKSNKKATNNYYNEEDDRSDNDDLENDSIQDIKKARRDTTYLADTTPRIAATTKRQPSSNRSLSNSDTSPLCDSVSIANSDVLLDRVNQLESDVALLKTQVRRLLSQGPPPATSVAIELSPFQVSVIGRIVRDEMFKAIKFMDATAIQVQGQKLFLRCLQAGKLEDQRDNKYLFDVVIKRARKSLNIFKSHVKSDIRKAARCK
jgi:ribosomal protein L21E